jgi:hypothetical protein
MNGCSRPLALIVAVVFVVIMIPIFLFYNLAGVMTDRAAVKEAVSGELLLGEAVDVVARQALLDYPALADLPAVVRDSAALQAAVEAFLPPGWATQQTDAVVDAVYDYLETGDESKLVVIIETGPLLDQLRGERGREMVRSAVEGLPVCTELIPNIDLSAGTFELPGCLPPIIPVDFLADQLHTAVVLAIDSSLVSELVGEQIEISLLDSSSEEARQGWQRAHRSYVWTIRGAWLLWLIPVFCLLFIAFLAVRSPGGLGHWWGWILVVAGGLTLAATLLAPLMVDLGIGVAGLFIPAESPRVLADRLLRLAVEALADNWLARVRLQAGLALIAGLFLGIAGFILNWMLAETESEAAP